MGEARAKTTDKTELWTTDFSIHRQMQDGLVVRASGIAYKTECNERKEAYVGKRGCKLKERFTEHHRSSPVGQHMAERRHSIDNESISVMHNESSWLWRGVAEAIYIREEAPILNLGREHHTLPPIFSKLMLLSPG